MAASSVAKVEPTDVPSALEEIEALMNEDQCSLEAITELTFVLIDEASHGETADTDRISALAVAIRSLADQCDRNADRAVRLAFKHRTGREYVAAVQS